MMPGPERLLQKVLSVLRQFFQKVQNALRQFFQKVPNALKQFFQKALSALRQFFRKVPKDNWLHVVKLAAAIFLNLLNAAVVICIVWRSVWDGGLRLAFRWHWWNWNWTQIFQWFTIDSNVLCAVVSLVAAAFEIVLLVRFVRGKGAGKLPVPVLALKLAATAGVVLTFLTVLLYLNPTRPHTGLYANSSIHMHLTGPVIALLTLVFLENDSALPLWWSPVGLMPELLYGIVYLRNVLLWKWNDFYGLFPSRKFGPGIFLMLLAGLAISAGISALQRLLAREAGIWA